jgi:hypothetical protein
MDGDDMRRARTMGWKLQLIEPLPQVNPSSNVGDQQQNVPVYVSA